MFNNMDVFMKYLNGKKLSVQLRLHVSFHTKQDDFILSDTVNSMK